MECEVIAAQLAAEPNHVRLPLLFRIYAWEGDPTPLVPALCNCLADPDRSVQQTAVLVLTRCGPEAVPPLTALLAPLYPADRRAEAAAALGRMGAEAAPACAALCECLRDADDTLRQQAIFALGAIGAPAVPHLEELLGDPVVAVSVAALEAMGRIGPAAGAAR